MKTGIVLVIGMLLASALLAQQSLSSASNPLILQPTIIAPFLPAGSAWWSTRQTVKQQTAPSYAWSENKAFAPAYDSSHLAFFCRLEVQLEKATRIPVRFRLGDVQQVDYLEGKFEGWRYGY